MRNSLLDDPGLAKLAIAVAGTGLLLTITEASIVPLLACGAALIVRAWAVRIIIK